MLLLSLKAGLRAIEIAALTWGCIREEDTLIELVSTKVASHGQCRSTKTFAKHCLHIGSSVGTLTIGISSSLPAMPFVVFADEIISALGVEVVDVQFDGFARCNL